MRLWHYKLLPLLDDFHIVAQMRELLAIKCAIDKNGTPNHRLVNKVLDYSIIEFVKYCSLVTQELDKRNIRYDKNKYTDIVCWKCDKFGTATGTIYDGWHNHRYLTQCFSTCKKRQIVELSANKRGLGLKSFIKRRCWRMSNMNFNCDVCGREVLGCTFVNGMKFCAKCYQETFGETDKDRKISDLEAKLAKSEKERELDNSFWKQECDSLQKTLVEKDKEIEKLTEELDDKNFCKDFVDLYTENKLKTQMLHENWKDKISFTIQQLEKVKELCREKFNWWENSEWEGNIYDKSDVSNAYFDIEANIEEQIKQLKELK